MRGRELEVPEISADPTPAGLYVTSDGPAENTPLDRGTTANRSVSRAPGATAPNVARVDETAAPLVAEARPPANAARAEKGDAEADGSPQGGETPSPDARGDAAFAQLHVVADTHVARERNEQR